jgi:hypothetical protein
LKNPSILEGFFYVVGMYIKKKISLKCPVIQGFRLLYHKIAPAALILDSINKFFNNEPVTKNETGKYFGLSAGHWFFPSFIIDRINLPVGNWWN